MKIAGVQMDVTLGDVDANLNSMVRFLQTTTAAGARLAVFPECALTGYCFSNMEEARAVAETVPGPATERMSRACADRDAYVIFGMLERDTERLFNVAVLVGADGVIGTYRKIHLPYLGVDRFTTLGDRPFAVHEAGGLRVGMNICYDAAFPEAGRALGILGADLIALPTNWPPGAECAAASCINSRALENGVYYVAVNRIGSERGFSFIGQSRICNPYGQTVALAEGTNEEILYADLDLQRARNKHYVRVPNEHEIDRMADRRPEMYDVLTRPHRLKRPQRG